MTFLYVYKKPSGLLQNTKAVNTKELRDLESPKVATLGNEVGTINAGSIGHAKSSLT